MSEFLKIKAPMDYKIISVESKKGGVGKTTAALNLARLLLDNNYIVLLIDIDITGTNITDTLGSSYWNEKINSILFKKEPVNLLKLYQDFFMKGNQLPSWSYGSDNNKKANFSLFKDQINIIGSEIYNHSKKVNDKKQENLICNPSILFDELHSFWFVEFLKSLCDSFANKADSVRTAIVFDNSPGFVGINPAIQDWLSDLGPIRSKFLTVSSLDRQDLISCSKSIEELHLKFDSKYLAARKYSEMINDNDQKIEFDLEGQSKDFFMRIMSDSVDAETKDYYNNLLDIGEKFIHAPSLYQSIIINKVPKEIKTKSFTYDFGSIWNSTEDLIILRKLLDNNQKSIQKHFVYFDENINFQFVESSLVKTNSRGRNYNFKSLIKFIDNAQTLVHKNSNSRRFSENYDEGFESFSLIQKNLNKYQGKLYELIEKLKVNNLQNIIRLIDSDWYPKTPFENLQQYFAESVNNSGFHKIDFELIYDEEYEVKYHQYKELFHKIQSRLENQKFRTSHFENITYNYSYQAVIYLTLSPFNAELAMFEEFTDIFTSILLIQSERIERAKTIELENFSFTKFLASENIEAQDMEMIYHKSDLKMFNIRHRNRELYIVDFYHAFCKAQARLLDLDSDFDFLLFIIKKSIIETVENEKVFFPYIRDILTKVIDEKSISQTNARDEAKKGFISANYMTEFQNVLKYISKEWGIL